ncbi:unnamed protein product, partial [Effrenium voratum]
EFQTPISAVRGQTGRWRVSGPDLVRKLQAAELGSELRTMPDVLEGVGKPLLLEKGQPATEHAATPQRLSAPDTPHGSHASPSPKSSQPSATQTPPHRIQSEKWGFSFAAKVQSRAQEEDPLKAILAEVRAAAAQEDVLDTLWSKHLFRSMKDEQSTYNFIQAELERMQQEEVCHREIAADPDCDLTNCFPLPFLKAAQGVSLKNGWRCETLLLSLLNNLAFLEHRSTRLSSEVGKALLSLEEMRRKRNAAEAVADDDKDTQEERSEAPVLDPAALEAALESAVASAELQGHRPQQVAFQEVLDAYKRLHKETAQAREQLHKLWERLMFDQDGLLAVQEEEYVREVAPAIPVLLAGPASSRKSTNCTFAMRLMTATSLRKNRCPMSQNYIRLVAPLRCQASPFATEDVQQCTFVEATLKGVRTALLNHGAVAIVTDEISNTLLTPWSDTSQGINFLSRSKLNTWSQAEADSVVTAQGRIGLQSYACMLKLYGQVEASEWVWLLGYT